MAKTYVKNYTNTFIIHGREYEVTAPARFDCETDQLVNDDLLDDSAVEMANQKYRDEFGLVSPDEIKSYRNRVGLSQRELADLLGVSPNTIALYETGAFPSKANNRILKALMSNDETLQTYLNTDSDNLDGKVVRKVSNYLDNQKNDTLLLSSNTKPKFKALQLCNWYRVQNYFAAEEDPNVEELSQMKVVKLLYFAFGRYLATHKERLFSSKIIAMPYGPVVEEVHQHFNGHRGIVEKQPENQAFDDYSEVEADSDIAQLLRDIDEQYGITTAAGLSQITHKPGSPWRLTPQGKVIDDRLIAQVFSRGEEK